MNRDQQTAGRSPASNNLQSKALNVSPLRPPVPCNPPRVRRARIFPILCFHTLTNSFFRNSFVLTLICVARGCHSPAPFRLRKLCFAAWRRKNASLQVLCLPLLRTHAPASPFPATHTKTPGMGVPRHPPRHPLLRRQMRHAAPLSSAHSLDCALFPSLPGCAFQGSLQGSPHLYTLTTSRYRFRHACTARLLRHASLPATIVRTHRIVFSGAARLSTWVEIGNGNH